MCNQNPPERIYVARHQLVIGAPHSRDADLICAQVNVKASREVFSWDERRVRRALDQVAPPEMQDALEISIVSVDLDNARQEGT